MQPDANNLIWIDLEMTGLDPDRDRIIEVATIVTDSELNILAEGPELAVWQPEELLASMDAWNTEHHGRSGLTERVRESRVREHDAERLTLEFLRAWVPPRASPMCGNSICQDRRFLYRAMRALEQHFHYRNLDVSTLKELCRRWAPSIASEVVKDSRHRALQDVRDSIEELRFYRERFLDIEPGAVPLAPG